MIRFNNGDPGGVPSSLSSDWLGFSSETAPKLLAGEVTGGSLPKFTAWPHEARVEYINSSHWWLGVITDSQFKQFKDAVCHWGEDQKCRTKYSFKKSMIIHSTKKCRIAQGNRGYYLHWQRGTACAILWNYCWNLSFWCWLWWFAFVSTALWWLL